MTGPRVPGHTLRYEGAPFDARGRVLFSLPFKHGGPGRGKCSCGVLSDVLPSAGARQRWHRQHKAEVSTR